MMNSMSPMANRTTLYPAFFVHALVAMVILGGFASLASCGADGCGRPKTSTTSTPPGAGSGSAGSGESGPISVPDPDLVVLDQSKNFHGSLATLAPARAITQSQAPIPSGTASQKATGGTPRAIVALAALTPEYATTDPAINRLLGLTESELDINNAFFQRLGTNQRTCASCHPPSAAWGTSIVQLQAIFEATRGGVVQDHLGLSAIFSLIDGANCPTDPVGTLSQRQAAYTALLEEGLIRIRVGVPAGAEFDVTAVADPYGCSATCGGGGSGPACSASGATLSEYRRPLPTTNLRAISTVMWDGRESLPNSVNVTSPACATPPCAVPVCTTPPCAASGSFQNQANNATIAHMQGVGLTSAVEQSIANFQFQNVTAQASGATVGDLTADGARGGPDPLHAQTVFIGHNDNFGDCIDQACRRILAPLGVGQRGAPFSANVFTIYNAWSGSSHPDRASIARGQVLFNTFPIPISNVSGINDEPAFCAANPTDSGCTGPTPTGPTLVNGGCVTCHDAPNFGNHTIVAALNIGLADPQPASAGSPIGGTTPGAFLPLYTATCNATGEAHGACAIDGPDCTAPAGGSAMASPACGSIRLTDLGRGLITGKWKQLGRFKGPVLRGMPARAPFFHNGFGTDPGKVLDFYEARFGITFSTQQTTDLINFLNVL